MDVVQYNPENADRLPDKPGVYKFFNENDVLIYVGKAKSLRKRVKSYFQGQINKSGKTRKLISEVKKIEITLVNSEFDAFLLENSLIKKHQPKYNILLKDDKTFPFVCITNERFPRVISTRKIHQGTGQYFGPYANVRAMNNILELIRNLYYIRTCNYNLSKSNIDHKKFKVCLEYHIGKCRGPCEGLQDENEYLIEIGQLKNILKGDLKPIKDYFKRTMSDFSDKLEFEKAEIAKQRLALVEKFQAKTVVVNPRISNCDVFSIIRGEKSGIINYLKVNNGSIIHSQTIEVKRKLEETDEELLSLWIVEIREKYNSTSEEILTNLNVEGDLGVKIIVPQKGDKRKLVELSLKNTLYYKKEQLQLKQDQFFKDNSPLIQLQNDLNLKNMPRHIECFDNSNIQGTNPVASMVCFREGRPAKGDYRKFHIRTVEGPDDFASMEEIVSRRYKRQIDEKQQIPDLIIIDGGKGQLSAAVGALKKLDLYGKVSVIGIAKRLEEIYFPGDELPLHIDKRSSSLKLIQKIRDEAHRFAITFHREVRQKNSLSGILDSIKGIGEITKLKILKKYRFPGNIIKSSLEELIILIGKSRAELVLKSIKKRPADH